MELMKSKLLFLIFCTSALFSCSVLEEPESQTIINLSDLYEISLNQQLKSGKNALILEISTKEDLHCPEATFDVSRSTSGKVFSITISDAPKIENCVHELIRLTESVPTGIDQGTYDISFNVNSIVTDSGFLNVGDQEFELQLSTFDGITLSNPVLKMIPDETVWGVVYTKVGGTPDEVDLVSDIVSQLLDPIELSDGEYGYFNIKNKEWNLKFPFDESGEVTSKSFLNSSTTDINTFTTLKKEMEEQYPNIGIEIFHGKIGRL